MAWDPPAVYRQRIEAALGDRKPLAVMAATSHQLAGIIDTTPIDYLRARPFAGKWTPLEILGHLADVELVYGWRLRHTLWEDTPAYDGFDQDHWVAGQRDNDAWPRDLLDLLTRLRERNLSVWHHVRPADLSRAGEHRRRGRETLADLQRLWAGHDLLHLDQIRRYLAASR